MQIRAAGLKALRDRIVSVKNTQKITEAMKLVAAAKVRRAQEAVVNGRPFSENLVKVPEVPEKLAQYEPAEVSAHPEAGAPSMVHSRPLPA